MAQDICPVAVSIAADTAIGEISFFTRAGYLSDRRMNDHSRYVRAHGVRTYPLRPCLCDGMTNRGLVVRPQT